MPKALTLRLCVGTLLLATLLLAGCSGSSRDSAPGLTAMKMDDYRGVGYEGIKPGPFPELQSAEVETRALPNPLRINQPPVFAEVPAGVLSFYRIPGLTVSKTLVVTLQPGNTEDSDLFCMEGTGSTYSDGADCLGYSRRVPTDFYPYSPDWVAFTATPSALPVSYVAVYGMASPTGNKRYRIEADSLWSLAVNGPSKSFTLPTTDSHWYKFSATNGTQYTVNVVANTGDPDIYVYSGDSAGYVGRNTAGGSGSFTFTASATKLHYVRVFGYQTSNNYTVSVTSP